MQLTKALKHVPETGSFLEFRGIFPHGNALAQLMWDGAGLASTSGQ